MTEDLGNIVISPQARVLTARLSKTAPTPPPGILEAPKWIDKAQKYVREDANNIASVDPGIDQDPELKGHAALLARQCVAAYNQLPDDLRAMKQRPSPKAAIPSDDLAAMAACAEYASVAYYWWGYTLYMDDCLVNDIVFGLVGSAAIAGVIAAVCPPAAPVAGVIAALLAVYGGWLQWADVHCGNQGAYVDGSWGGGAPWISTVC